MLDLAAGLTKTSRLGCQVFTLLGCLRLIGFLVVDCCFALAGCVCCQH
jgi:hypothetical protein